MARQAASPHAFVIVLLTLLGARGESLGMDRHLKSNTAKHRTHLLFRQGCMSYELILLCPNRDPPSHGKVRRNLVMQNSALEQTFSVV